MVSWSGGLIIGFWSKLAGICCEPKLSKVSTDSLHRGGATALHLPFFPLFEIKDMGDGASFAVLQYISRSLDKPRELDGRICELLFAP